MRPKKLQDMYSYRFKWSTHKMLILTHTEVTNTISNVYITLDYKYRHENKGIDQNRDDVCRINS